MSESEVSRGELRRAIREELQAIDPSLRVLAENVLGEVSRIDLLAIDGARRPVLILIAGENEDLACVSRGLALRAWVRARVGDWIQLAPDLEFCAEAGVRTIVVCRAFDPETRSAAENLGPAIVELATWHQLRNGSAARLVLQGIPLGRTTGESLAQDRTVPAPFRSGLTDEDLDLSPSERSEFE